MSPAAPDAGQRVHRADEIAASEIEGRSTMPVWQSAFTLGPNVRFSRTPEAALSRRTHQETVPQASQLPEQQPEPIVVSQAPSPESAMAQAESVKAAPGPVEVLPTQIQPSGARAITFRLRQEFEGRQPSAARREPSLPAPRYEPTPVPNPAPLDRLIDALTSGLHVPSPREASGNAVSLTPVASASYLSDHAFWESVALTSEDEAPPVPESRGDKAALRNQQILRAALTGEQYQAVVIAEAPAAPEATTRPQEHAAEIPKKPNLQLPFRTPLGSRFHADDGSISRLYRGIEVIARPHGQPSLDQALPVPRIDAAAPAAESAPAATVSIPAPVDAAPPALREPAARALPTSEADYEFPAIDLLQEPSQRIETTMTPEALEQSAGLLESVLEDFGIKGEIIDVRPGPVVTLYEFEPAPGVKSSRVIGLSDDIARSMSALSARVAVIPGRNVIGIELPNPVRETVFLRELIEAQDYAASRFHLPLCLGKTIGGEPVIVELAKMPHLLVAGTTGSGKSVAINTMILSLLYRLKPEECRLIMVDPKMLELSVYDGIPHLLTPVVTDPKKAVMALKWAVREMEERYKKMSRLGVRNIDGYNTRAAAARAKGETIMCTVQNGFDRQTGELLYEQEEMDLTAMPYIVVIVDEMADLMMVAGKEIEGAIQRLAQMARAAGIHLIMATQRPSVDVITGTIKANFPTRISFQVTSKIDSRTILGEPGAEHLLGQGDMLHMMGGGRIARVHGPFVSDEEVEKVVAHLKTQGRPEYLGTVTEDADEPEAEAEEDTAVFDKTAMAEEDGNDLYEKAVKLVMRDKKCSTSYIQRRLGIGYNRAASLVERMEQEGLVGPANHVGKRAILAGGRETHDAPAIDHDD
ncbi:S-DNA-T family DNA segregation ATPase FtsK/SpoIIIE [Gellertiella hungarica]|uniref:S-DNA-T family DNA segregation ATPase FtsK/SpoIIIE n=1 Tax=Gellertiella hungarica TaxID=1572859 RepID=A0A7W6J8L5_9HYPH|nr:S-DNA-T family DNA segregation ATPase FtsK/SpoIIIE [Gellertiella hungarica]